MSLRDRKRELELQVLHTAQAWCKASTPRQKEIVGEALKEAVDQWRKGVFGEDAACQK